MAKLVDPTQLLTLQEAAKQFGYHSDYLRQLARDGRLEAWLLGKTWVTTRAAVKAYKASASLPGRPPGKSKSTRAS